MEAREWEVAHVIQYDGCRQLFRCTTKGPVPLGTDVCGVCDGVGLSENDMLLSRVYMDKYKELESLLVEKDLALNETYMVRTRLQPPSPRYYHIRAGLQHRAHRPTEAGGAACLAVYRTDGGDGWQIRESGRVGAERRWWGACGGGGGWLYAQALQKTYSANKMQEETLKDLQLQLKELSPLQEAGTKLETETAKTAFLAENSKQAEMTAAMCRQEAAAAVREKENQIWQHQQALERAREDVDELQRVVKEREGVLYHREMKLVASAHEMRGKLQSTSEKLNEREKSIHWLAERKRMDNEQHACVLSRPHPEWPFGTPRTFRV